MTQPVPAISDEMVERLAKQEWAYDRFSTEKSWEHVTEVSKENYRRWARRTLEFVARMEKPE